MQQHVLVVDDSESVRSLMKHMLAKRSEFLVDVVGNGQQALERVNSESPPMLVLLDINMPVMDGLEFLDRLARLEVKDRVKVIIISTETRGQDVVRGLEAGASGYLRKPFTTEELYDTIDFVLA